MAELTKDKILALITDPNFNRQKINEFVEEATGLNIDSIANTMTLSDEDYANLILDIYNKAKAENTEELKKLQGDTNAQQEILS